MSRRTDRKAYDLVRTRIAVSIGTREDYEKRYRNLHLFINHVPPLGVAKVSPAAIQLALLNNIGNDFAYPSFAKQPLLDAALLLGEENLNLGGNVFRGTYPHVYSIFEAYVVLRCEALKPGRPVTHHNCNLLYQGIVYGSSPLDAALRANEDKLRELLRVRETDATRAKQIRREHRQTVRATLDNVASLFDRFVRLYAETEPLVKIERVDPSRPQTPQPRRSRPSTPTPTLAVTPPPTPSAAQSSTSADDDDEPYEDELDD